MAVVRIVHARAKLPFAKVVLGVPFTTLLPILAEQTATHGLASKEAALGMLHGTLGAGAILGAAMASTGVRKTAQGKALLVSAGLFGLGLIGFAASKPLVLAIAFLLAIGVVESIYSTLNATLVQRITHDAYRGRVMSVYNLIWGMTPIGGLSMGLTAKAIGPATSIAVHGGLIVLVVVGMAAASPALRRMK